MQTSQITSRSNVPIAGTATSPPHLLLPNKRAHVVLGILQMTIGASFFVLNIIGVITASPVLMILSGFIGAAVFFTAGFLGFYAARRNSRNHVIGCLVLCIIAVVVGIVAGAIARGEHEYMKTKMMSADETQFHSTTSFQMIKCTIFIAACGTEFLISLIHAGMAAGSCCGCCPARQTRGPRSVPTAQVIIQSQQTQQPQVAYKPVPQLPRNQPIRPHTYPLQQGPPGQYPMQQGPPGHYPMQGPPGQYPLQQPPGQYPLQQGTIGQYPMMTQNPYPPPPVMPTPLDSPPSYPEAVPSAPPSADAGPLPPKS